MIGQSSVTYIKPLTNDETILLLLKEVLNHNIDVCKYIMKFKHSIEESDTLNYHIHRWRTIAKSHYDLHKTHEGKFSYIFNLDKYVIKEDHKRIFFYRTGVSYQLIELLHELIKLYRIDTVNSHIEDYKYWVEHDDMLFSHLATKIMKKMKNT